MLLAGHSPSPKKKASEDSKKAMVRTPHTFVPAFRHRLTGRRGGLQAPKPSGQQVTQITTSGSKAHLTTPPERTAEEVQARIPPTGDSINLSLPSELPPAHPSARIRQGVKGSVLQLDTDKIRDASLITSRGELDNAQKVLAKKPGKRTGRL